uniref:lipocalin family protein n=1 Tax=Mucilaginibacter phyllosphaerae TaxID=1812349 RepID=UPI0035A24DF5
MQLALAVGAGVAITAIALNSCVSIPKGANAVSPFDKTRYLGKWYELARFDFKFEKGLDNVTASYFAKQDGTIEVVNRGRDYKSGKWKESVGKAKFVKDDTTGRLKVSFFGPFYAGYNVVAIDRDYQYALVAGNNLDYLWILSRTTSIPDNIKRAYLAKARSIGYNTNKLIWTKHGR